MSTCLQPSDFDPSDFWFAVRRVIKREWIRLRYGSAAINKIYDLTPAYAALLEELVAALQAAQMVPGLATSPDSDGKCLMNWLKLACFGRYYGMLDGPSRRELLSMIADGQGEAEWAQSELLGHQWYFCIPAPDATDPQAEWCCDPDITTDPYYAQLASDVDPDAGQDPAPGIGGFATTMIVVGALSLLAALGLYASHELPRHNPTTEMRQGPSWKQVRTMRAAVARRRSFEDWDEAAEYLRGSGSVPTGDVLEAAAEASDLSSRLSRMGLATSARREAEALVMIAAEAQ